jgi:ACS family sodium-dependent inorganic phosphate cotransporter
VYNNYTIGWRELAEALHRRRLCFLAAFVCYIDRVNISVAVLAIQDEFGWTETTKGLVLSAFFVGYMLFQVPSG